MPSSITHAYLAKDIYQKLDNKIKKQINLESYKTYSQGLDVLYFYHIFLPITKKSRDIIKLGRLVHNQKTNDLLINLTKNVKKSQNKEKFTYLVGLVTHYLADSTMHPFINYQASLLVRKNLNLKDNHFIMETYLDNYLIKEKEKIDYRKFKGYNFCFNAKENREIKDLLNESFKEVFKKDNIGIYYFKSLKQMKFFFHYLRYDPYKIKYIIYQIINPLARLFFRDIRYLSYNFKLDRDNLYLNNNHDNWFNIDNKKLFRNSSFFDLYEEVIGKGVKVIESLYDYIFLEQEIDLEKLFENKSYANGLVLKK